MKRTKRNYFLLVHLFLKLIIMDLFRINGISFLIKVPFDTKHFKISNFFFATREYTLKKCQLLEVSLGTMRKL